MSESDPATTPPKPEPSASSSSASAAATPTDKAPANPVETSISAETIALHRSPILRLRTDIPRWLSLLAALLCMGICFLAWWYATSGPGEERILGHTQLPSPQETIDYFPKMWDKDSRESHLFYNTVKSLKRVSIGFTLALIVGVPLGVAAGCFAIVRAFLSPLILFGRNIPVAALTALVFALFSGEMEKYMFIFIACVAFILSDTADAIRDVAQRYVETALTLGASRLQIILKVLVPLALPTIFNSARILFGLAFGYIMLVEIVDDAMDVGGLGKLLNTNRRMGNTEVMAIILLAIPLVAWVIDQCLSLLQCLIFRWKYGREAERNALFQLSRGVMRLFWR